VAVPGWPTASRQPRTLLAGVVAAQSLSLREILIFTALAKSRLCAQFSGV
jgi:hypothetical protein